ncbi:MAG TPA: hypothetical protein VIF09_24240 [Polyangiaceae bacterium]
MRRSLSLSAVVVVTSLAPCGVAHAGSAEAETAFREGRKAMQVGDYPTACARFADSERLEPAPGTLLNLAECETHIGKLVSAHEHFGVAASGFPRGDVRRTVALSREAEIDKRVPRLILRLAPSAPLDAIVHEGESVLESTALGTPKLVDPGRVIVVVTAAGRVDRTYTLTLKEGDQVEQALDAGEPAPAGAATPPSVVSPPPTLTALPPVEQAQSGGQFRRTLGFAVGGVGVAGLAVGALTGILALDRASTVKQHCPNQACDPQGLDAASQGKWMAPTSTVSFIAGGVLVAAGAYLVFFGGGAKTVALAPSMSTSGVGALLQGAF